MGSVPVWTTQGVQGQPELCKEISCHKQANLINKQTNKAKEKVAKMMGLCVQSEGDYFEGD